MYNYRTFLKEGKLYIEREYEEDTDWKLIIDISDIWKQYSNKNIDLDNFNNLYIKKLNENKNNISSVIGEFCWDEINNTYIKLQNGSNIKECEKIYNKLYDIFDKYEIKLEA